MQRFTVLPRARALSLTLTLPLLLSLLSPLPAADELDLTRLVEHLTDLDRLPYLLEGEKSIQHSSYDRASRLGPNGEKLDWGANGDAGHYIRVEPTGEAVMAEVAGPGVLTQSWSANPQGKLHFYIDGAAQPIVFDFTAFTTGGIPEIPPPISTKGGGAGANCYLPIPFAKSCVIKADKAHGQYYHFDFTVYPQGTQVTSFRWPLSDAEKKAIQKAANWLGKSCGEDPGKPRAGAQGMAIDATIAAGNSAVLAELKGPGVVTALRLKLDSPDRRARRAVLLRAFWDGEEKPSIEAPIGDFFASTWDDIGFRSLPIGMTDQGGYSFWRMPFWKGARFEVSNDGKSGVRVHGEVVRALLDESSVKDKGSVGYFHAKWRREAPNRTFDWPYLRCEGKGRFVGVTMSVQNPDPPWFGEGDEKVYVDGEAFPSWFGTGTEDYFCDAWGFRPFIQPTHGCPIYNEPGKTSVYRWHVMDSIPFSRTFEITIENYGNNKDYSSVAYWYATPANRDFFVTPTLADRMPWPMKIPGALEAEDLASAGAAVVSDEDLPVELSGGKGIRLPADGKEMTLRLPLQAPGVYRLVLFGPRDRGAAGLSMTLGGNVAAEVPAPAFGSADRIVTPKRMVLPLESAATGTVSLVVKAQGGPSGAAAVVDALRLEPAPRVEGAIEAEALPPKVSPGGKAEVSYSLEDDTVSGCAFLRFRAKEAGEWLEVSLPEELRGKFQVVAKVIPCPVGGVFQCAQTGVTFQIPAVGKPPVETDLGSIELPGGKLNAVRLVAKSAGSAQGFDLCVDFFRRRRIIVEGAIEAEGMRILREENSSHQPQGLGELWSGDTQLFCPGREGQFVELELPVKKAGRYSVGIYFTKAADYGIVEVELDGKKIGDDFNGYNNGVIPSGKVSFGTADLTEGAHRLTFRSRKKDPQSSNFFFGVDCLTLTPAEGG